IPSVVPASTVNETLSTAETYAFEYSPIRTGNLLCRRSTLSNTGELVSASGVAPSVVLPWSVRGGLKASAALLGPVGCVMASSSGWLSAAHRHCLASLARWNLLFLHAISFQKPWGYF